MITLVFFKVAVTASIVFALMFLIDSLCGHQGSEIPEFVPYVGVASFIIAVVCYVIALIMAVWL
jgi:hypothetical protein